MKKFPASEGWIRMEMTLKQSTPLSEDYLKRLASFGKPGEFEWAKVEQHGKKVKIIYRQKDWKPSTLVAS